MTALAQRQSNMPSMRFGSMPMCDVDLRAEFNENSDYCNTCHTGFSSYDECSILSNTESRNSYAIFINCRACAVFSSADWTVDDAWVMYQIINGESGVVSKRVYQAEDGSVIRQVIPWRSKHVLGRNWHIENYTDSGAAKPVIFIDDELASSVEAAMALTTAIRAFRKAGARTDFANALFNDLLDSFLFNPEYADPGFQEKYIQFKQEGWAARGEDIAELKVAVEMGVSIASTPAGFVIDMGYVKEDFDSGRYGMASFGLVLACLGPVGDILKPGQAIDITKAAKQCNIGQAATDAVRLALTKGSRPEIMDALRPLLRSEKITPEFLETMYDSGFLKSKNPYGTLERFIKNGVGDFPGNGVAHVKGSTIRHHDFPRQFERDFIKAGYDPDTVGRAIAESAHKGFHTGTGWGHGGPWNHQWDVFFNGNHATYSYNPKDPEGSIKKLLDKLRDVTKNPVVKDTDWPIGKGMH